MSAPAATAWRGGTWPVPGMSSPSSLNGALARLFDADWYCRQYPDVASSGSDPLRHYLEHGAWEMANPNPLFDSAWYLRTVPEAARAGLNPLVHYVQAGAAEHRDPHPLFDTRTYLDVAGRLPNHVTPLELFLSTGRDFCAGAYRSLDMLETVQQHFLRQVRVELIADRRAGPAGWAVFLQCGRSSLHRRWLSPGGRRPWHVIANFYDDTYNQADWADVVLAQSLGTKFSAIHRLLEDRPGFLEQYDYILYLDDDVLITEEAITRLFRLAETLQLQLAQPALTQDSVSAWEVLKQRSGSLGRYLNAVEIMMPLIKREALLACAFLFPRSISGWGLDFALGGLVRRLFGPRRIAVVDALTAAHRKPVDTCQGAYYRMLKNHGLSALVEERANGLRYGFHGPIAEISD